MIQFGALRLKKTALHQILCEIGLKTKFLCKLDLFLVHQRHILVYNILNWGKFTLKPNFEAKNKLSFHKSE